MAARLWSTVFVLALISVGVGSFALTHAVLDAQYYDRATMTAAAYEVTLSALPPLDTDATGATALCNDGTYSHSLIHQGTCSAHKGVARWLPYAPI